MSTRIEMTLQELYDAVWSMPIAQAAARCRMTSRRLKNSVGSMMYQCARLGIGERASSGESATRSLCRRSENWARNGSGSHG